MKLKGAILEALGGGHEMADQSALGKRHSCGKGGGGLKNKLLRPPVF